MTLAALSRTHCSSSADSWPARYESAIALVGGKLVANAAASRCPQRPRGAASGG